MQNTSEIVDCNTHIRTSPFARAVYDTEATSVVIYAWNDVYTVQASAAEIGVYVNGVYQESVRPTANGASVHTVALPAGDKRVEIVTSGYRGPAVVAAPTFIGPAMWLKALQFNKPAAAVRSTERGVLIIGDSIVNGSKLASPVQESYVRMLQAGVNFPVSVLGRGGLALQDVTTTLGTETNFNPRKIVREVIKHNPQLVLYTLGYNDAARSGWNDALYRTAVDALSTEIAALLPGVEMGAMTLLYASNQPANYAALKDSVLTCTSAVGFAAPTLTAGDLDADGIHPNAAGHVKIAAALAPYVNARAMWPAVQPFDFELVDNPLWVNSFLFTRQGGSYYYKESGGGNQEGPRWYFRNNTTIPGDFYRYRHTLEAGTATANSGVGMPAFGAWSTNIQTNRGFSFQSGQTGRVRVDIAAVGTTDVLASYRIWRGAAYAP